MSSASGEAYSRIVETILKLSKERKSLKIRELAENALLPKEQVMNILSMLGFHDEEIRLTRSKKIEMILHSLEWGIEGERVARYLDWREFEELIGKVFAKVGYEAEWNLNVLVGRKRCQIDLLAHKGNLILLIDCKHWKRPPPPSAELKIVEAQEKRLRILKEAVARVARGSKELRNVYLVPLVLSLYQPSKKILQGHVFASIGRLRGLLDYLESAYFQVRHEKLMVPAEEKLSDLVSSIHRLR